MTLPGPEAIDSGAESAAIEATERETTGRSPGEKSKLQAELWLPMGCGTLKNSSPNNLDLFPHLKHGGWWRGAGRVRVDGHGGRYSPGK